MLPKYVFAFARIAGNCLDPRGRGAALSNARVSRSEIETLFADLLDGPSPPWTQSDGNDMKKRPR